MTKRTEIHQDERVELYEIGYLVVPTVAEEQLPGVVQEIKNVLEKHEAIINHEGAPVLQPLAYEIAKVSVGKRQRFDKAYFGWITFKTVTANAGAIKKEIDTRADILRYILIKADEPVVIAPRLSPTGEIESPIVAEDLDKKIDTLAVA